MSIAVCSCLTEFNRVGKNPSLSNVYIHICTEKFTFEKVN